MHDILYLGSQSPARQQLLKYAGIPFKVIAHQSDEQLAQPPQIFADLVQQIAYEKMRSLTLPSRDDVKKDYLFVVTADSLIKHGRTGEIFGKPLDKDDAIRMLKSEGEGYIEVATGVIVEKLRYHQGSWQTEQHRHWTTSATIEFYVDHDSVEKYLSALPIAMQCSGAGVIEGHGLSYLKSINGSYTAAIGLPLYELRHHLVDLGFIFA